VQQKEKSGMKWNKSTVTALQQIKDKKYPDSIQSYAGDILLVGINYSKKEKKQECVIEECKKN
jgi:hypothetical protein